MTTQRSLGLQYINTALLTLVTIGVGYTVDTVRRFNEKIDNLNTRVTRIESWQEFEYAPLKDRIIHIEAIIEPKKNYNPVKDEQPDY